MNRHNQGFISYTEGHLAEKEAISFMQKKGYKLFDSNIYAPKGVGANEIDLIFTKENTIIFIEVKKRKQIDEASYSITPNIQKRLFKAAELFLSKHSEFSDFDCRFDCLLTDDGQNFVHIENAFGDMI